MIYNLARRWGSIMQYDPSNPKTKRKYAENIYK